MGPASPNYPNGLPVGSYPAQSLTQDQRNWLWSYFGHGSGSAPVGYGGEDVIQPNQPAPTPSTDAPAEWARGSLSGSATPVR